MFVPLCCCSSLFSSNYLKKMLDENAAGDDTIRLLRFLCWENWDMSLIVLNELLSWVRGREREMRRSWRDNGVVLLDGREMYCNSKFITVIHPVVTAT